MATLLVIESDGKLSSRIGHFFSGYGHRVEISDNLDAIEQKMRDFVFDVIICDVVPEGGPLADLLDLKFEYNASSIMIVTYDITHIEEAVQAIRSGAFDLIQKPYRVAELYVKIEKAIEIKRLQREAQSLRGERKLIYSVDDFIAYSPKMRESLRLVEKVANSDSSVIIEGETGTGKELIAGTIHYSSHRAENAFVKVNCAALPESLLESELFGHEKGAFTGADKLRIGRFEQADGGSILLDEIGDVTPLTQVKILRVLQEKEFERVGSNRSVKVDVRIISATNKNLEQMVEDKTFRDDLYYRLKVVTIKLPPLRERREDILPLATFFLRKYSGDINKDIRNFQPNALQTLMDYHWPGNIRELENAIERAIIMAEGNSIEREDLNLPVTRAEGDMNANELTIPPQGIYLEVVEKNLIIKALESSDWVQKRAAQLLHLTPRSLNYKINKHGITHSSWKKNA